MHATRKGKLLVNQRWNILQDLFMRSGQKNLPWVAFRHVESTKQSDMSSQWSSSGVCQHRGPWLTALCHRQATAADGSKPKFLWSWLWLWVKIGDVPKVILFIGAD
eukprot:s347_g4.t1